MEQINSSSHKEDSPNRKLHNIVTHKLGVEELKIVYKEVQDSKLSKIANNGSKMGKGKKIRKQVQGFLQEGLPPKSVIINDENNNLEH